MSYSLPSVRLTNIKQCVEAFEELESRCNRLEGDTFAVNLPAFVEPFAFAILEALRLRLERRGKLLRLIENTPPTYGRPFSRIIGFGGNAIGAATTIPLHAFQSNEGDRVGVFLRELWARRARALTELTTPYVVEAVGEVFANAFTHSHSDIGTISCGQYIPKKDELHLSVLDLGIGIPRSIAESKGRREEEIDASKAVAWAFEEGNTTMIGMPRGLGLAILRNFLRRSGATLHVFSGRGYASLMQDKWSTETLGSRFPGTLIDIQLPASKVSVS